MSDLISRQAVIEAVHKSIFDFFDICDDNEETPMTQKDELLLELNKAITTQIKAVVSAQLIEAVLRSSIDLQELEDRFGKYVKFVVEDMMSGEGKRWKNEKDSSDNFSDSNTSRFHGLR